VHPFTLLGDPVRLRIVELLASGEKPVSRLVEVIGPERNIGQSAISHHLRILKGGRGERRGLVGHAA